MSLLTTARPETHGRQGVIPSRWHLSRRLCNTTQISRTLPLLFSCEDLLFVWQVKGHDKLGREGLGAL